MRPDGRISIDLIGDVDVRGHTIDEVRTEITRRLKEFIVQPDVTVDAQEVREPHASTSSAR